jgi:hypothetical protein
VTSYSLFVTLRMLRGTFCLYLRYKTVKPLLFCNVKACSLVERYTFIYFDDGSGKFPGNIHAFLLHHVTQHHIPKRRNLRILFMLNPQFILQDTVHCSTTHVSLAVRVTVNTCTRMCSFWFLHLAMQIFFSPMFGRTYYFHLQSN